MLDRSSYYKASYGSWAGDPKGRSPDYTRCCEEVHGRERWGRFYQCSKPRGYGPEGAYCKQHDPEVAKARRAAADERSKKAWNDRRYEWNGRLFFNALVKIAEGYNDARGLAQQVITEFRNGDTKKERCR